MLLKIVFGISILSSEFYYIITFFSVKYILFHFYSTKTEFFYS